MLRSPPAPPRSADATDDPSEATLLAARVAALEAELAQLRAAQASAREAALAPLHGERDRLTAELADQADHRARLQASRQALGQFGPGAGVAAALALFPLAFLFGMSLKAGALALLAYALVAAFGWWRGSRA
jgi:hypothetical protein